MPQLIWGAVEKGIDCGHAMCSNCRVTGTIEWTLDPLLAAVHGHYIQNTLAKYIQSYADRFVRLNNVQDRWGA